MDHDIPFHYIKVTKENKREAEAQQMRIIEETGAELIVLARYMQVLSDEMSEKMSGRIINIHHSFLPSFKGANPTRGRSSSRTRCASPTPRAHPTM